MLEPPPTATLLGRIFAHRRAKRTVVSAPLVHVDESGAHPEAPPAETERDIADMPDVPEEEAPGWVPSVDGLGPEPVAEVPPVEEPEDEEHAEAWPPLGPVVVEPPVVEPPVVEPPVVQPLVVQPLVVPLPRVEEAPVVERPVTEPSYDTNATERDGAEPYAEPYVDPEPAEVPDEGPATRYCAMCGDRVPIDDDGQRCYLGHRLSPAHADAPRGGRLRRLLRRR